MIHQITTQTVNLSTAALLYCIPNIHRLFLCYNNRIPKNLNPLCIKIDDSNSDPRLSLTPLFLQSDSTPTLQFWSHLQIPFVPNSNSSTLVPVSPCVTVFTYFCSMLSLSQLHCYLTGIFHEFQHPYNKKPSLLN